MEHTKEIESLKQQIIERYQPRKIVLFGSCAKGIIRRSSDIDLCVIVDTDDRRKLLMKMNMELESEIPFDIVLYTPHSWAENVRIRGSFANLIETKGAVLYG